MSPVNLRYNEITQSEFADQITSYIAKDNSTYGDYRKQLYFCSFYGKEYPEDVLRFVDHLLKVHDLDQRLLDLAISLLNFNSIAVSKISCFKQSLKLIDRLQNSPYDSDRYEEIVDSFLKLEHITDFHTMKLLRNSSRHPKHLKRLIEKWIQLEDIKIANFGYVVGFLNNFPKLQVKVVDRLLEHKDFDGAELRKSFSFININNPAFKKILDKISELNSCDMLFMSDYVCDPSTRYDISLAITFCIARQALLGSASGQKYFNEILNYAIAIEENYGYLRISGSFAILGPDKDQIQGRQNVIHGVRALLEVAKNDINLLPNIFRSLCAVPIKFSYGQSREEIYDGAIIAYSELLKNRNFPNSPLANEQPLELVRTLLSTRP